MAKMSVDVTKFETFKNAIGLLLEICTDKNIDVEIRQMYMDKVSDIINLDDYYIKERINKVR